MVERFVVGLQVMQCGCSSMEEGRALVSPIHAFLRSRINLLDLISSFPLFYDNCKFALPGTVPCPAEALRLRSWSCGGDSVVRRQVFNTSDGFEFAGFAGLP